MRRKVGSLFVSLFIPFLCLAGDDGLGNEVDLGDFFLIRCRRYVPQISEGLDFERNVVMTNDCIVDVPTHLSVLGHRYDVGLKMTNDFFDMVMYELKDASTHKPVASIDVAAYSSTSNALESFCLGLCQCTLPIETLLASYTVTNISGVALFSEQPGRNETGWTNNVFAIYGRSSVQVRSSSNAVDIALAVIEAGTRKEGTTEDTETSGGDGD